MGGPGASVLLRNALTKQHKDELEIWLRSITSHLEKGKWAYEFWLKKDAFPGTVSDCLFYLSVEDVREYWDDDEKRYHLNNVGREKPIIGWNAWCGVICRNSWRILPEPR